MPNNQPELLDAYLDAEANAQPEPSLTYRINFGNSRLGGGMVDELDAIKQYVVKAILTCREHFHIYSDDYGCELETLIGSDVTEAFIQSELPRMVREAIIFDDRIIDVTNVSAEREGDAVFIVATVESIYGEVTQEVTI
ncbi:DUF2634 domain-containing protein [Cytobacillus massiliigabonensis]|uniref:DUF2634 domain-containing protein n=1 Tax=Cytobacillus massiliigabonensis TaxID=1871011 RepID=UPI001158198E|nr:DUF2634 domain-containing protein [Cytobacillus massiliigabonensis]